MHKRPGGQSSRPVSSFVHTFKAQEYCGLKKKEPGCLRTSSRDMIQARNMGELRLYCPKNAIASN